MKFAYTPFWRAVTRLIVIALLAIGFTALCVSTSKQKGRLSSSPNYDDVVYFNEGAILLQATRSQGLDGVRSHLNTYGLHSPFSTVLAASAYGLLGPDETSPYYANALLVMAYLGCIAWLGRNLRPAAWLATLLLALALPFITMGVVEFRPDIAWATVTGFGAVFILTRDELFRRPGRAAVAGLLLALALLIKPSTFVMTGLLFTGAVALRFIPAWREHRLLSRQALRGVLFFGVTVLVVAGPYWLRFGKETWRYFYDASFGINKSIWVYPGSLHDSLFYYISGGAFASTMGGPGLVLIGLTSAASLYLLFQSPPTRWPILSLAVLVAGAFFVNTMAQMKTPFLGGGMYGVYIFGGFYLIGAAWQMLTAEKSKRTTFMAEAGLLSAVAVAAILLYKWPRYSNWSPPSLAARNANYRNATNFINDVLTRNESSPPKNVMVLQAGPIVPEIVSMWFPLHKLKGSVHNGAFTPDIATFTRIYPQFEWVVIQEQGVLGYTQNLPAEAQLPRFLEILKANSAYHPIAEYLSSDQRKIWVYARSP